MAWFAETSNPGVAEIAARSADVRTRIAPSIQASISRDLDHEPQARFVRVLRIDRPTPNRKVERGHDERPRIFVEHAVRRCRVDGWRGSIDLSCGHKDWRHVFLRRVEPPSKERQLISIRSQIVSIQPDPMAILTKLRPQAVGAIPECSAFENGSMRGWRDELPMV
jgi:hypothetical protein